ITNESSTGHAKKFVPGNSGPSATSTQERTGNEYADQTLARVARAGCFISGCAGTDEEASKAGSTNERPGVFDRRRKEKHQGVYRSHAQQRATGKGANHG